MDLKLVKILFSLEHQPRALRPGVRCSARPKERESSRRRHGKERKLGRRGRKRGKEEAQSLWELD